MVGSSYQQSDPLGIFVGDSSLDNQPYASSVDSHLSTSLFDPLYFSWIDHSYTTSQVDPPAYSLDMTPSTISHLDTHPTQSALRKTWPQPKFTSEDLGEGITQLSQPLPHSFIAPQDFSCLTFIHIGEVELGRRKSPPELIEKFRYHFTRRVKGKDKDNEKNK